MKPILKLVTKLIISMIFGIFIGTFYFSAYSFSIEAASICSLISIVLMINILNLIDDALVSRSEGGLKWKTKTNGMLSMIVGMDICVE